MRTGYAWRYLPVGFPPWQTVYSHFQRWNRRGVTERILTELREQVRLAHDRHSAAPAGDHRFPVGAGRGHRAS
ncbi:transposase [Micromonospora aurantiaca (nom. illeg.)]